MLQNWVIARITGVFGDIFSRSFGMFDDLFTATVSCLLKIIINHQKT